MLIIAFLHGVLLAGILTMSSSLGSFACPQCGQPFDWQPRLAGRKLVCACGTLLRVPDSLEPPPLGIIALCALAIVIVNAADWFRAGALHADQIANLSIHLGWDVAITAIAGTFLGWLFDTSLGALWIALLKLAAIAMAQYAVFALVASPLGYLAYVFGYLLALPVLWFLLSFLFELDFRDSFFGGILITLLRFVSYFGLWKLLP